MREGESKTNEAADYEPLGFGDYLGIAQRRKWLVVLASMAVVLIVAVVAWRMPDLYRAETVILVDPQKVPDNYVASTVTTSISDRLSTIQQEVTSPTRLEKLMDSLNLFPESRKKNGDQAVIASMQKAITVKVLEEGSRSLSAFRVGFSGRDPRQVAEVANKLAAMFIAENVNVREQQSYGTAEFLENELQKTKDELDAKEAELNEVKSKYMLDLPESKQYHLEALTTLRNQLRASQDRVNQDQQQKVYLQSLMMTQAPTVDLDTQTGSGFSRYTGEIQKIEAKLSTLRSRYGDDYPDVRALKQDLLDLQTKQKKEASDENAAGTLPPEIHDSSSNPGRVRNPVLEAQIQKLNDEIEKERKAQPELEQQIAFHTSKLERIPVFEERISGLMWVYDSLRAHYSELLSKKLSADMASSLETRQKAERFLILDPAVVPQKPYSPKRGLIVFVGLFAGLAAGLGLAVAVDMSDSSVRSKSEALRILSAPVLAEVPDIRTHAEIRASRLRLAGAFVGTAVGSVVVGFAISLLGIANLLH